MNVSELWDHAGHMCNSPFERTYADLTSAIQACENGLLWDSLYAEKGSDDYEPTLSEQNAIAYLTSKVRPTAKDIAAWLMWKTRIGGFLILLRNELFNRPPFEGDVCPN